MAFKLANLNPLGKSVGGKTTDVFVGGFLGLALSGLLKRYVVDNVFQKQVVQNPDGSVTTAYASETGRQVANWWPVLGAVLSGAALGAFGHSIPGVKRMNTNALMAGAVAAAAAPFVYGMIAGRVPFLSETVSVALQGYSGLIVKDTPMMRGFGGAPQFGLMTQDAPGTYGFADLAALSMGDDDDGLADLVAVNF